MSLLTSLRQLRYPREFRIAPPRVPPALWPLLEGLLARSRADGAPPAAGRSETGDAGASARLLTQLGTDLWRLRQKMIDPATGRPLDSMRRAFRHLESAWDTLAAEGLTIQDHTDTPYDAGLALKVVAFQPTPGFTAERVTETIKPSIYLKGRAVQMGEVIVGTPESGPSGAAAD